MATVVIPIATCEARILKRFLYESRTSSARHDPTSFPFPIAFLPADSGAAD